MLRNIQGEKVSIWYSEGVWRGKETMTGVVVRLSIVLCFQIKHYYFNYYPFYRE